MTFKNFGGPYMFFTEVRTVKFQITPRYSNITKVGVVPPPGPAASFWLRVHQHPGWGSIDVPVNVFKVKVTGPPLTDGTPVSSSMFSASVVYGQETTGNVRLDFNAPSPDVGLSDAAPYDVTIDLEVY